MKILIVDDSATMRLILSRMVTHMGHEAVVASNGAEALVLVQREHPDLVLLDVLMGDMDGYTVAREIREHGQLSWMPIIFLSSRQEDNDLQEGIESGGDDYLIKPVSYVVLHAKIRAMQRIDEMRRKLVKVTQELEEANRELARLSHHDGLTSLPNRRHLDERLASEIDSAQRQQRPLSLLLIDVDHFKRFNDAYGHVMGDACLIDVAGAIRVGCRRPSDFPARYGGEEFAVLLPDCNEDGARRAADAVLDAVRDLKIPHSQSSFGIVTVSLGILTAFPQRGTTAAELIRRADAALYRSKQAGRNRASFANDVATDSVWLSASAAQ